MAAGITASGGDAYIMHVTTTPSISFISRTDGFDCGVMISASHNGFCDNGIKLVNGRGEKLERGVLNLIEDYLDGRLMQGGAAYSIPFAEGGNVGRSVDYAAGRNRYIGHLISLSAFSYKGVKVGLDCANGAGFKIAKSVFDALGATVTAIGAEPNGVNINDGCGSTCPAALAALVKERGLDIGFAFDGDADRCICIDERGRICDGDGIMYLSARHMKARGELLGDRIVATVMSNGGLKESLLKDGICVEECPVGDSFVHAKMCECGAALGGEQSGHIIYGKLENTGDGLVTALSVMEAALERGAPLSELVRGFDKRAQTTVSVRVRDKASAVKAPAAAAAAEEVRGLLGTRGRLIIRPSGTESVVRVTVECESEKLCGEYCRYIENALLSGGGE